MDWAVNARPLCPLCRSRFTEAVLPNGDPVCQVCEGRVARSVLKGARAARVARRALRPMAVPKGKP